MSGDEIRSHWYKFWADGVSDLDMLMLFLMVFLFLALFLAVWYWGIPALSKALNKRERYIEWDNVL